jgi:hypothetical protein
MAVSRIWEAVCCAVPLKAARHNITTMIAEVIVVDLPAFA